MSKTNFDETYIFKISIKSNSFDVIISIKILFFRFSSIIELGRSLLQFVITNCLTQNFADSVWFALLLLDLLRTIEPTSSWLIVRNNTIWKKKEKKNSNLLCVAHGCIHANPMHIRVYPMNIALAKTFFLPYPKYLKIFLLEITSHWQCSKNLF